MMTIILILLFAVALTNIILKVNKTGTIVRNQYVHIQYLVAWYDLWAGIFIKGESVNRPWYIMLPTFGLIITRYKKDPTYTVYVIAELEEVYVTKSSDYRIALATPTMQLAGGKEQFYLYHSARKRAEQVAKLCHFDLVDKFKDTRTQFNHL
jgi:hypothetical protein